MKHNLYNAIFIGTGISGGWAAKELCEKVLKTHWSLNVEEMCNISKIMMNDSLEILEEGGLKNVEPYDLKKIPGSCIHETGTDRMSNDPKTSVLNRWNQIYEVLNVFVTDGPAMCSSGTTPGSSITYMALIARAVDHAVKELNRRNL